MENSKYTITSKIYFNLESEGGMSKDFYTGMRFDITTDSDYGAICQIMKCQNEPQIDMFVRGNSYIIILEILSNKSFKENLLANKKFNLMGGKRLLATGIIME